MLNALTDQLKQGNPLSDEQVVDAVGQLIDESISAGDKADFLAALATKGETENEIASFARELRDKSVQPPLDEDTRASDILDVCGTGGDKLNTFNISTTVAILLASAGVAVAKHGNRAITSKSGSADVLEALGIPVNLSPEQAAQSLNEHGFAFFFAPLYHPAFKGIMPARKLCAERGQRTIFNFLGPLLNPTRPTCQLIGVPRADLCEPMAKVLQSLGIRRGMVVSGKVGDANLDELSTLGMNTIAEFYQDRGFSVSENSPADFPLQSATLDDLKGGTAEENATMVRDILNGRDHGPKRDAVLLNAAGALLVSDLAKSMSDGWELAGKLIDDGVAGEKLNELSRG